MASTASRSRAWSSTCAAMLDNKDKVVDGLTKGIEFLFKKNKVDYVVGTGQHREPRQGGGPAGRRRRGAGACDQEHPDRHRLGRHAAAGRDDRRGAHRLLHRCARPGRGARAPARRRRRLYRPRDGHGLAPAGGARSPSSSSSTGSRPAWTARSAKEFQKILDQAGHELQARHQGHRRRRSGDAAQGHGRARQGRCGPETIEADTVLVAIGRRPVHRRARPGEGRRAPRQSRPGRDRRALPHQRRRASGRSAT